MDVNRLLLAGLESYRCSLFLLASFIYSNPDDLVSRGVARNGLVDYWLWWTGPPLAIRNSVIVQYLTAFMKFRLKRR